MEGKMKIFIRYFTPAIILIAIFSSTLFYLIEEISEPSHVFSFTQNIKFMFGRVDWTPLFEMFKISMIMFAFSMCFTVVKQNWLKATSLFFLIWFSYAYQIQYLPIQLRIAETDMIFLLQENIEHKGDYQFSYQSFVSVGSSIFLSIGLILNIVQLYGALKNRNH